MDTGSHLVIPSTVLVVAVDATGAVQVWGQKTQRGRRDGSVLWAEKEPMVLVPLT
jgi:hypothetical protein